MSRPARIFPLFRRRGPDLFYVLLGVVLYTASRTEGTNYLI